MRPLITIDNSMSNIVGLTKSQFDGLRNRLSYKVDAQAAYFSGYGPRIKYCIDKRGEFGTGLFHRVIEYLNETDIDHSVHDKRVFSKGDTPIKLNLQVKPYPDQINAAEYACVLGRGTISMPTGSGKSLVIALIASRLNCRTLVIVPTLEIKRQLTASLNAILGHTTNVVIENIDSPKLKTLTEFDCLIIDEAHHVAAKTYQKLNKTTWNKMCWRFFLTATPFRNNTEETLLFESIADEVIYELDYETAVERGYIVPIEAYYIEIPKQKTDAYTWAEVYRNLVVYNEQRNAILATIMDNLHSNGVSALCLVKEIAHGKALERLTSFKFVCGEDEESRDFIHQFNNGIQKVLIGTSGILGEGIDTKPAEYAIIAGLGKAKSAFMQQVGRVLRQYPGKKSGKVIIFKDKSHRFCSRHFKIQCDILKEIYGVSPIKLDI
jgi:superfamily II DNA or RNA helicase